MSLEGILAELDGLNELQVVQKLVQIGFIKPSMTCNSCEQLMVLKPSKDSKDGYNWRCMNYSCPKYQTTRSIRAESWIDTICICPKRILKILLYWSAGKSQKDILDLLSVSRATLSKFKLLIIAAVKKHYEENPVHLGGPGVYIQADETMLNHKVKSH